MGTAIDSRADHDPLEVERSPGYRARTREGDAALVLAEIEFD